MSKYNVLDSEEVWKIYKSVVCYPGISFQEILEFSGKSQPSISEMVKPLVENNIITITKVGRKNTYYANNKFIENIIKKSKVLMNLEQIEEIEITLFILSAKNLRHFIHILHLNTYTKWLFTNSKVYNPKEWAKRVIQDNM